MGKTGKGKTGRLLIESTVSPVTTHLNLTQSTMISPGALCCTTQFTTEGKYMAHGPQNSEEVSTAQQHDPMQHGITTVTHPEGPMA